MKKIHIIFSIIILCIIAASCNIHEENVALNHVKDNFIYVTYCTPVDDGYVVVCCCLWDRILAHTAIEWHDTISTSQMYKVDSVMSYHAKQVDTLYKAFTYAKIRQ